MDRGTDCRDVLLGKTLKLKHGWVAVVNRGQADINSKVRGCGKMGCADTGQGAGQGGSELDNRCCGRDVPDGATAAQACWPKCGSFTGWRENAARHRHVLAWWDSIAPTQPNGLRGSAACNCSWPAASTPWPAAYAQRMGLWTAPCLRVGEAAGRWRGKVCPEVGVAWWKGPIAGAVDVRKRLRRLQSYWSWGTTG